jgi:hypothetical protein
MGLLGKAGMVAGAGAIGYAVGTVLDEKLGLSDRLSKGVFDMLHPEVARANAAPIVRRSTGVSRLPTGIADPGLDIAGIGKIDVHIHDHEVKVEGRGVHSPKVMARRSVGGN